jgi:putative membrane protein
MMHWMDWMNGFGWGSWGWIGLILNLAITLGVIVGIVVLVVWLARQTSPASSGSMLRYPTQSQPTAREILQARYARGEINREEFRQMLSDVS